VPEVRTLGAGGERPRTLVVGCGGAGCNALGAVPPEAGFEVLGVNDLPHRSLAGLKRRLILPKAGLRDVAGMDEWAVKTLATTSEQMLAMELGDADLVVPMAGLGGETGGWAASLVARVSGIKGATTLAVVTMPFTAEGANRRTNASDALAVLRRHAHGVLALPNDTLLRVAPHLPILRAFETMSRIAMQPVLDLVRVLTRDDLPSLRGILRSATVWSAGVGEGVHNRPESTAVEAAFRSAWLAGPPDRAREAIVLIGLPALDDRSVDWVLRSVDYHAPKASVAWGAYAGVEPDRVRVTVLVGH